MPQIRFEERAVAFIDVLGFKSLVNAATVRQQTLSELQRLVELLEGVIPDIDRGVEKNGPQEINSRTYLYF